MEFDLLEGLAWFLGIIMGGLVIVLILMIPYTIVDDLYKKPQSAEKANEICRERGFDHQVDFTRKGLWSTEPLAVECGYVKEYRLVDLNINKELPGGE